MIEKGKKVTIKYEVIVDGSVIDKSDEQEPFIYEHGTGQILPALEKALEGLNEGENKELYLGPDDAYGAVNPQAIVEISKEKIQSDDVTVGSVLTAQDPSGKTIQGFVREVLDDHVTVDFNHPLAGKEIHFKIAIVQII